VIISKIEYHLSLLSVKLNFTNLSTAKEILTISCTLNFPDSLSLVEDWIRFSLDCSLVDFLRVGDADFDFNLSLFFSEKNCFWDLAVDSIKA